MNSIPKDCRAVLVGAVLCLTCVFLDSSMIAAASSSEEPQLVSSRNEDGSWGLGIVGAGMASARQSQAMHVEMGDNQSDSIESLCGGYATLDEEDGVWLGTGTLKADAGFSFDFEDRWTFNAGELRLQRRVTVRGDGPGGFMSGIALQLTKPQAWPDVNWFAPGMIYGGFDHLSENAIGGRSYYKPGNYTVRIREERMPAPVMAGRFSDGSTLAVLNPTPAAESTAEECMSVALDTMTDKRFGFGAIGAEESEDGLAVGYWFPGSEGEQTYSKKTAKGSVTHHQWRRRFHPIKSGLTQQYEVAFRFGKTDGPAACYAETWRWAWKNLEPQVNPQDLATLRKCLVDVLAENVMEVDDRAGIHLALYALPNGPKPSAPKTILGFIGKALESAEFMLAESCLEEGPRSKELRRKAEKIVDSFVRIKMSPPEGEGFYIESGKLTTSRGRLKGHPEIYLRCFCDDMKSLLRAYRREQRYGHEHPRWLAWAQEFADWLLTQQQPAGGFPRAWLPKTGEVYSDSPNASFNAIPFLVELSRITGEKKYLEAAVRAGDFCWENGQAEGCFVGGTIDNPDVIDKEAATVSLEGYLLLVEDTADPKWLDRAKVAADVAETWMYIWNIPMPDDAEDDKLHWKRGIPTVGVQLIASGHSLVDAYMAFDVDEYARLYRKTGDEHYLDVARILLHNTKAMIAIPGRPLGLRGLGWQQEHFSLAPPRSTGRHQFWLPWVATSQLNGIFGVMELDETLFNRLASEEGKH